jgi:biotin operon repressor
MRRKVRRYCRAAGNASERDWYLVSSQGSVLYYIAANPGCTGPEIAEAFSMSLRSVWGTIGALRRAGMLCVRRDGHQHHYTVNLDASFDHPSLSGITLRDAVGQLGQTVAPR